MTKKYKSKDKTETYISVKDIVKISNIIDYKEKIKNK